MQLNEVQKGAAIRVANRLRMPANTVTTVVGSFYDELNRGKGVITCPECGRTYKTKAGLASHTRAKH